MAKLRPNEKRCQLSFERPEDIALYDRLAKMADERRYPIGTFILLALQDAFRVDDKDAAYHPVTPEPANNTPAATDTDLYRLHHNLNVSSEQIRWDAAFGPKE